MLKRVLLLSAFAFVATAPVAQASETTKAIVASYLEIHMALAADKIDGVKPAAAAIAKQAEALGEKGEKLIKAARAVESAGNIKAARNAFGNLSAEVIAAAKTDEWKDLPDVKLAYCPMVNKSWLQKGDDVKNPYYGSSMLTCGEFKKR